MIAANELRIGNWVLWQHLMNIQVKSIHIDGINGRLQKGLTYWYEERISGIPLEPDILEKCGFVDCENAIHDFCWFKIEEDGVDLICDHVGVNKTPIKYLHQLQNLYFALTNIELEINL